MDKIICIFGDSTAWGAWDLEKGGWVNRLWFSLAESNSNIFVYNLSISGGTTKTILERFESESKIREADYLIFQSGGNDSYLVGKNGSNNISLEQFKTNVEDIIRKSKSVTKEVLFIGFKNVDESKTTPVAWKDIYYSNAEIKKYDETMKDVCEKNSIPYLDIYGLLENKDLDDGLHPNSSGNQKIFEVVRGKLLGLGWIKAKD